MFVKQLLTAGAAKANTPYPLRRLIFIEVFSREAAKKVLGLATKTGRGGGAKRVCH